MHTKHRNFPKHFWQYNFFNLSCYWIWKDKRERHNFQYFIEILVHTGWILNAWRTLERVQEPLFKSYVDLVCFGLELAAVLLIFHKLTSSLAICLNLTPDHSLLTHSRIHLWHIIYQTETNIKLFSCLLTQVGNHWALTFQYKLRLFLLLFWFHGGWQTTFVVKYRHLLCWSK